MSVILTKFSEYHVTGTSKQGKRFKKIYDSFSWANGINLFQGSVWGVLPSGKRKLLKRVYN